MDQSNDPRRTPDPPPLRDEALVQIRLHADEQRIILHAVEERLGPLEQRALIEVRLRPALLQHGRSLLRRVRRTHAVKRESWIELLQQPLLVPLQLDPRRVPDRQIEPTPRQEYFRKLEFPMMRTQPSAQRLCNTRQC